MAFFFRHPASTWCVVGGACYHGNKYKIPSARQVVITAGSPSGMAATARATAILK